MVIPTAAAYNVNLENLAASYAIMTAGGIATAQSTTYLNTMLVELSNSSSDVSETLENLTGKNFSELMSEGKTLGDVLQLLCDSVDGDTVAFGNLWKSATAGRGALALVNAGAEKFNSTLDSMYNSAGAADKAFEQMSDTGEHVQELFDNAWNNFAVAWGNAQPSLDGLMNKGTEILNILTDTINKCPQLASGITSVGIALGVFTTVIGGYTLATGLAAKATAALTAVMDTNPVLLMATVIVSATIALGAFLSSCDEAELSQSKLTASSQKLSDEIEFQEKKVRALEDTYGKNNETTLAAKAKLGELKAQFEATGETTEQFARRCQETAEKVAKTNEKYAEAMKGINDQRESMIVLITELQRLEGQSSRTAFQQEYEKQIIEELNNAYPDLGLAYDEVTGKLNNSTQSLKKYCEQKLYEMELEAKSETLIEKMKEKKEVDDQLTEAQENLTIATEKYNAVVEQGEAAEYSINDYGLNALEEATIAMENARAASDALTKQSDELQSEIDELSGAGEELANRMNGVGDAVSGVADPVEEVKLKMSGLFDEVTEQAEATAEAIKKAYDSAVSAIDSTFSAYSKYEEDTKGKAADMADAMDANAQKMNEYSDNLKEISELTKDIEGGESLVQHLASGGQEQIDTLDNLLDKIHQLGTDTEAAKEYIEGFVEKWNTFNEAKDTLAQTMMDMNTELQTQMDALKSKMEKGIEAMNLDQEAGSAAAATMNAYLAQIEKIGKQCEDKAKAVAAAVKAALESATSATAAAGSGKTVSSGSAPKHAEGTLFGENVYIAGENGPELIVGRMGSEVFPASETAKILNAVMAEKNNEKLAPPSQEMVQTIIRKDSSTSTENRNVTLTISGKGSLDLGAGVSQKDLRNFISSELEGALVNILQQEIYEEGAFAYEF